MKPTRAKVTAILLTLILLLVSLPACLPREEVQGYLVVVPKVLHIGEEEAVSFSLFKGNEPAWTPVELSLAREGKEVFKAEGYIRGKGEIKFTVPEIKEGEYELEVKGRSFADKATIRVEKSILVFLETDKPIYKPGQTIHIRVISLNSELKPVSEEVTVEALDAKGIKIFRKKTKTDKYGMANLDLPICDEPNLGVWKLSAKAGKASKASTELDVRVEKYVLPKYEIKVELPKDWFLVSEPIKGKVKAEYSFGKPVKGELEIEALRYVGRWEKYAAFSTEIEGEAEFEIPPVRWVAGVPAARGMGNVMLNLVVKEKSTNYQQKLTKLLTISRSPLSIQLIPESTSFKPGLPFNFLLVTETPDNKPREAKVKVVLTYINKDFKEIDKKKEVIQTEKGKALFKITPPEESVALTINASAEGAYASKTLTAGYSPTDSFIHVEQISPGIPKVGEEVEFKVYSTREAANFYYEVISRGKIVFTNFTRKDKIAFRVTPLMAPSSRLLVYQILPNSEVAADWIPFKIEANYPLSLTAKFSKAEVRPGEKVRVEITSEGVSEIGLAAVDKSVFILAEKRVNLHQVFAELERLYLKPQVELHEARPLYRGVSTKGAKEIFEDAGVVVLSNQRIAKGKEY